MKVARTYVSPLGIGKDAKSEQFIVVLNRKGNEVGYKELIEEIRESKLDKVVFIGENLDAGIDVLRLIPDFPDIFKILKKLQKDGIYTTLITYGTVDFDVKTINDVFDYVILLIKMFDFDYYKYYSKNRMRTVKGLKDKTYAFIMPNNLLDLQLMQFVQDNALFNEDVEMIPVGNTTKEVHRVINELGFIVDEIKYGAPVKNLRISDRGDVEKGFFTVPVHRV